MGKRWAAVGSAAFLAAAPVVVAGVIPWRLTRWRVRPVPGDAPVRALGGGLVAGGAGVLAQSFARFVIEGLGTPMPAAPTQHLVTGGLSDTFATPCTSPSKR